MGFPALFPRVSIKVISIDRINNCEIISIMSAAQIIREIEALPPDEKDTVVKFAVLLGPRQPLSPSALGSLATQLAGEPDDAKAALLTEEIITGFYGNPSHA